MSFGFEKVDHYMTLSFVVVRPWELGGYGLAGLSPRVLKQMGRPFWSKFFILFFLFWFWSIYVVISDVFGLCKWYLKVFDALCFPQALGTFSSKNFRQKFFWCFVFQRLILDDKFSILDKVKWYDKNVFSNKIVEKNQSFSSFFHSKISNKKYSLFLIEVQLFMLSYLPS